MKKLLSVLMAVILTLSLCGCNFDESFVIDKDGNVSLEMIMYFSPDELAMMLSSDSETEYTPEMITEEVAATQFEESYCGTKVINGVKHYGLSTGAVTYTKDELQPEAGNLISSTEFVYTNATNEDLLTSSSSSVGADSNAEMDGAFADYIGTFAGMNSSDVSVTLPSKIVLTNGTLSKDKKTATFHLEEGDEASSFYAYTADSDEIINFSGLKNDAYTNSAKIKVVTPDKLTSVEINGTTSKSKTIQLPADGEYNITVTTRYSTKTITVTRDTAKPVVKGVENGQTYKGSVKLNFSDKGSGVAAAKLNGKKIKSGKTITKAGNYTLVVTDNAGNKTTIKFTVK